MFKFFKVLLALATGALFVLFLIGLYKLQELLY